MPDPALSKQDRAPRFHVNGQSNDRQQWRNQNQHRGRNQNVEQPFDGQKNVDLLEALGQDEPARRKMLQWNAAGNPFEAAVNFFDANARKLQIQQRPNRRTPTTILQRQDHAVDFFPPDDAFDVRGGTHNARVHQRLSDILSLLVEKTHHLDVVLRTTEDMADKGDAGLSGSQHQNPLVPARQQVGGVQRQPQTDQQDKNERRGDQRHATP